MIRRVLLALLAAVPLYAQSLHWRSVDVHASLDGDGNLHVVERQRIVFDGEWNGAERNFGQGNVQVHRISRVDDGGREITLVAGDVDQIDHWKDFGNGLVRWRSRLETDPPFANREITYVLDYSYRNVLTARDGRFLMSHDFGLPNREGTIERFTLAVDFDPVWNREGVRETRAPLAPGESVVVSADLAHGGQGWPAGVPRPLPWWAGPAAVALLAAGATLLIRAFIRAERAVGRFDPLPAQFDAEVLKLKPELAGAVWDAGVGPAEVAALLARMSQEGKITTRAEGDVLHLQLNVPLSTLPVYEGLLASKLFVTTTETDTKRLREQYKSTGFNPARVIRPGVESALAEAIPGWKTKERRFNPVLHGSILLGALFVVLVAALFSGEPGVLMAAVFNGAILGGVACVAAYFKSRAITDFPSAFVLPGLFIGIPCLGFAAGALKAAGSAIGIALLFAIALWLLALLHLVLNMLKIRDPREVLAFRKRVAGTRKYILEQLQQPQPALRDEWFPYVLAFGLGLHVDQWFRAFGGVSAGVAAGGGTSSSSWSSSSSSASSWTGGGGAFGGAGATGTWAVAAGAIAAGVAAPGSRGGGGGGGGSSSGGGGGGGW